MLEKEVLLLRKIKKFYRNTNNMRKLIAILNSKTVSLSLIDWFITVYAKREKIIIKPKRSDCGFIVHDEYKNALKSAQKRYFDIFCRYDGIEYRYTNPDVVDFLKKTPFNKQLCDTVKGYCGQSSLVTAVCQMNICMWIIENGIFEYINDNLKHLKIEMRSSKKTKMRIGKMRKDKHTSNVEKSLQDAIDVLNRNLV